ERHTPHRLAHPHLPQRPRRRRLPGQGVRVRGPWHLRPRRRPEHRRARRAPLAPRRRGHVRLGRQGRRALRHPPARQRLGLCGVRRPRRPLRPGHGRRSRSGSRAQGRGLRLPRVQRPRSRGQRLELRHLPGRV
ncbi:MAG: Glyoxalase family protein, partial [uncultured Acidimicrobiales bacterium]